MPSQLYETLKQTATAHVAAYESPKPWDLQSVEQYRTPDYVHYLHPTESLPEAFSGPIHPTQFAQAMALFGPVIEALTLEIKDIVIDEEQRSVVVRLKATYDFKAVGDEPEEKGYLTDYMWFTQMDETGQKIKRVEEFMDPQRLMGHVQPKAERYLSLTQGKSA